MRLGKLFIFISPWNLVKSIAFFFPIYLHPPFHWSSAYRTCPLKATDSIASYKHRPFWSYQHRVPVFVLTLLWFILPSISISLKYIIFFLFWLSHLLPVSQFLPLSVNQVQRFCFRLSSLCLPSLFWWFISYFHFFLLCQLFCWMFKPMLDFFHLNFWAAHQSPRMKVSTSFPQLETFPRKLGWSSLVGPKANIIQWVSVKENNAKY